MARLALITPLLLTALVLGLAGRAALGAPEDSVVRVEATVSGTPRSGSGFVVRVDGGAAYVATAAHVVEGDPTPSVFFRSQPLRSIPASSVQLEGGVPDGFAVLRLDAGVPSGIRPLAMAEGGGSDLRESAGRGRGDPGRHPHLGPASGDSDRLEEPQDPLLR